MVYFTLFHLDPKNLISFDQYLAITSNIHWWILKWWLWLYSYSSTSKWSDRTSFFTIRSNEWWKVLSEFERSMKHRADFILPLTNKERYKLLEGGPTTTWEERGWKLWNDWWNTTWLNRGYFRECFGWWQLRSGHKYIWIHRQNVAKTIQVQRLWKEDYHDHDSMAEICRMTST